MLRPANPRMKIGIVGSGALGSLFAAHLAGTADLVMLGHWPAQEAVLRDKGLTLIGLDGTRTQHALPFASHPANLPALDIAILLVKAYQTLASAQEVAHALKPGGLALTLQNGLGNDAALVQVLGAARVARGVTAQAATMVAPGVVRHAGQGPTVLQDKLDSQATLAQLAMLLSSVSLETTLVPDIEPSVWGKLAVNAGINPLTAILRVPNGFLATEPLARDLMGSAATEVASVAAALGIKLPFPSAAERATAVAAATSENLSSMLQDVLRGAPTEIEAISGAVGEYGRSAGIPTPINDELRRLVLAQSATGQRPRSTWLPSLQALLNQLQE